MAELVALRLCLQLKVFANIPPDGSISSTSLAEKIGINQSFLGIYMSSLAKVIHMTDPRQSVSSA